MAIYQLKDLIYLMQLLTKRKHNNKYDYSNNHIDRTGHTYLDYLAYLHEHPGIYVWQLDFLGSIKTDTNNILSCILPNLQFVLLDLIKNPNQEKVVTFLIIWKKK